MSCCLQGLEMSALHRATLLQDATMIQLLEKHVGYGREPTNKVSCWQHFRSKA